MCEHCERWDATRAFYAIGETAPSHDRRETVVPLLLSVPICLQCSLPPPIFLLKRPPHSSLAPHRHFLPSHRSCQEKPTFLLEVWQEVLSPQPWSVETKAVLLSPCVAALIGVRNFEDLCVWLPLPRPSPAAAPALDRTRTDGRRRGGPHLRVV